MARPFVPADIAGGAFVVSAAAVVLVAVAAISDAFPEMLAFSLR